MWLCGVTQPYTGAWKKWSLTSAAHMPNWPPTAPFADTSPHHLWRSAFENKSAFLCWAQRLTGAPSWDELSLGAALMHIWGRQRRALVLNMSMGLVFFCQSSRTDYIPELGLWRNYKFKYENSSSRLRVWGCGWRTKRTLTLVLIHTWL